MFNTQATNTLINDGMRPMHPGEILRAQYLEPLQLSTHTLARRLFVPTSRLNNIVLGRKGITADTALRLARYFGGDAQTWLNLQMAYDLHCVQTNTKKRAKIGWIQPHEAIDMSIGAYRFSL